MTHRPATKSNPYAHDIARSQARMADIELGLTHPLDAPYWRDRARQRVQFLDDDEPIYGLLPHEQAERDKLKELLEKQ